MPVKFIRRYSIYQPGQVVAFDKEMADELVRIGVASFWVPNDRPPVATKTIKK